MNNFANLDCAKSQGQRNAQAFKVCKKERGFVVISLLCMYKILFPYVCISWHALKISFRSIPITVNKQHTHVFFFFPITQRQTKISRGHSNKNNDAYKYPANAAFFVQISQRKQKKIRPGKGGEFTAFEPGNSVDEGRGGIFFRRRHYRWGLLGR